MKKTIILFADNDKDFLETRAEFLQREGFTILLAFSPVEAKNILERGGVDLAILDLRLLNDKDENDLSGLDLAKEVTPTVPKIILTGFPSWQSVRGSLGAWLDELPPTRGYVAKDEGPHALLTAIRKVLSGQGREEPPNTAIVRRVLVKYFDLDELRDICFDLGVDFDSLGGEGKAGKARELVAYLQRRGELDHLIATIRRERPGVI